MKMRRHSKKRQEKPTVKGLTYCLVLSWIREWISVQNQNQINQAPSDLFTGTIHGNTDCYLQFCAPRLPQGAVSGRVSAAARVRPACAGLSLGRLALVTPTCLLVATSLLSIYRYPKSFTHYSRRPHAPPSPGRHPVVSSYLAGAAFAVPRCHCTVVVVVADRFATTGAPCASAGVRFGRVLRRGLETTASVGSSAVVAAVAAAANGCERAATLAHEGPEGRPAGDAHRRRLGART